MKMKCLDATLLGLIWSGSTLTSAQLVLPEAADSVPLTPATSKESRNSNHSCNLEGCSNAEGLLFRVQSQGSRQPVTKNTDARSGSERLQPDRRVSIDLITPASPPHIAVLPGRATVKGTFSVQLPQGGIFWATTDPTLGRPELGVSAPALIPLTEGQVSEAVNFFVRTNYPSFIHRMELLIFRASDSALTEPLSAIGVPVAAVSRASWDGKLNSRTHLRTGDELMVVLRAYGDEGAVDETLPRRILLVRPEQAKRAENFLLDAAQRAKGTALNSDQAQTMLMLDDVFARNDLSQQNITIRGARVRLFGRNLPQGAELRINGESYPADLERKFAAEFLMPVGRHRFELELQQAAEPVLNRTLEVEVSGQYLFGVGLADLTLWGQNASGPGKSLAQGDRSADLLADGRLAFFGKAQFDGRLLLTAQLDTTERDLKQLFSGFTKSDPQDLFRSLDPAQYYPSYGDDSTTTRDVDTQGHFYLRAEWDGNEAMWGNYTTGLTGTEYAQYVRALYGAAIKWRSRSTNPWGEPRSQLRLFASEAPTAPGHSEFIGTGGSLYYLRHADILPGSEQVTLELRNKATGRVESRVVLQRGVDYEMNALQGRVLLSKPLSQTVADPSSISHDSPLGGLEQHLLVDYEWRPNGFDAGQLVAGGRFRQWLSDYFAVGLTAVDERRQGQDYRLTGMDLTLRGGRGTLLRLEHSRTEATAAPVFFSDNGGISFTQPNTFAGPREGSATAVEGQINLKELGWTHNNWSASAWWRRADANYSVVRNDSGLALQEEGAQFRGELNDKVAISAIVSRAERGDQRLDQARIGAEWRATETDTISTELRSVTEQRTLASGLSSGSGLLGALRIARKFSPQWEVWTSAQLTLNNSHGSYASNNAQSLGANFRLGELASIGAQATHGDRGNSAQLNGEYRFTPEHTVYATYTHTVDSTEGGSLFEPSQSSGWTLGQRWRLSERTQFFNESQFLKAPSGAGLGHVFGLDFYPGLGWNAGFTLQQGELETANGQVNRRAASVSGGRTVPATEWRSKLEWREDTGAERRQQWVMTHRFSHKFDEDWRVSGRMNASKTNDQLNATAGARYLETGVGVAWRPHDSTRWAWLARYTYLFDLATQGQEGGATVDQKSHVLSTEAVYRLNREWEFAGKLAGREGQARVGRGSGDWYDSATSFAAMHTRYTLPKQWQALFEYRWLGVLKGGNQAGWLVGVDRDLGDNVRMGVGFNFTQFSDDLTQLDFRHQGWYLNLVGRF